MYCLVDFRNRPQLQHTFDSPARAREYLWKIKNNPLGVTVIFANGRREYFENGLPAHLAARNIAGGQARANNFRILRGCHVKYRIRCQSSMDGLRCELSGKDQNTAFSKWNIRDSWLLFMLGNRKFYACLAILTLAFFSSSYIFEARLGSSSVSAQDAAESGIVLGASIATTETEGIAEDEQALKLADDEIIFNLLSKIESEKHEEFEKELLRYVKGRPMEAMAPYIAKQPRTVAAFLVGIAMKESKFGVYAPHNSSGRDCYNYWGYRGSENTTASGYSCFSSPEHAIQVVGKKISKLVAQGISNPAEMISWKCGSSCAGHGDENVRKWISDVGINFYKINS